MQYAAKFQGKSKFLHGQHIILRALFGVALVTLSLFGQPSSSSDSAMSPGCIAMTTHADAADHMDLSVSADHGTRVTELHSSICASAGCLSAYIQEGLPQTALTPSDTVVFSMFERESGAGRAVSPDYRPPITG